MPAKLSKWIVLRDSSSYCSAPPLTTSSHILLPPRLTRAEEARRPRALLRAIKAEVRESEKVSVQFVVDEDDDKKTEIQIKIEPDPRQLVARVATITIRQPGSAASTSSEEAQVPSTSSYRTQSLCRVPSGQLGPADPPRRPGRPKGSKSQPRIAAIHNLPVPCAQQRPRPEAEWHRSRIGLSGALHQSPSGLPPVPKRRSGP